MSEQHDTDSRGRSFATLCALLEQHLERVRVKTPETFPFAEFAAYCRRCAKRNDKTYHEVFNEISVMALWWHWPQVPDERVYPPITPKQLKAEDEI